MQMDRYDTTGLTQRQRLVIGISLMRVGKRGYQAVENAGREILDQIYSGLDWEAQLGPIIRDPVANMILEPGRYEIV